MNLFWREMKANRKSLIGWTIGVLFMVIAGMSKYGGFSNSTQSLTEVIEQMPKALQTIFGMGSLDIESPMGFFGVLFLYLVLMGTIHALMLGADIISKEERDKTSEFLMVKPISRIKIISFKLLAALTNILLLNIVTLISSMMVVNHYSEGEVFVQEISLLMVGLFLLQLLFMLIGTGLAAVSKKPKAASGIGTGILLLSFILSIVIELNENLEGLKYVTPFKYFEAKNIINDGDLDPIFILISLVIMAVCVSVTYIFYKKRDLHV